jgi:phenylacetate-CoA ligase
VLQELQKNKEKTDFYITSVLHVKSWLRSIESMSVELQRKMQENLLGDLFRHAWQYSDWWRKRILQAGYIHDLENLSAFSVLDNIAPLLRTDVQEHFESLRAWRSYWSASDMVTSITSGSTGIPVRVEKLRDAYNLVYEAVGLVDHEWHQRDATLPLLSLAADEDSSSPHWGSLFLALQGSGSVMNRYPSSRSSYEHAKWLMEHRPSYLKASPLRATEIGEVLLSQGNVLPLRQIISQSERVTPQQREICRRAFGGAKIVDRYSCEEVGWLAIQCPEHDHLHVMTGTTIIEIVDDHGNPCPVGVAGRVLVTNLHSFAMPIIRYDIGDIAEWGEECDCGIKLPVIRRLLGRKRNMVRLHDGTLIPMTFLGDYFEDLSVIKEYRLVQQKNGDIDFLVRAELPLTDNEVFKLRSLVLKVNAQLVVHIREVSSIDWGKGMKREEFVRLDE